MAATSLCFRLTVVVALLAALSPLLMSIVAPGWMALYLSPPYSFNDIEDLTGKVAIVTGANTGIGKVTVRELARKGARVIGTARNQAKGKMALRDIQAELGGKGNIDYLDLDLSSMKSVESFVEAFRSLHLPVDMLILNAGVMMCPYSETEEGYEMQFGANHLGHFLLVKLLMHILSYSKSRVVVVSSSAHKHPYSSGIAFDRLNNNASYDPIQAYGQSKLANILFASELAVRHPELSVNAIHPGLVSTDLQRHVDKFFSGNVVFDWLRQAKDVFMNAASLNVNDGALTQLFVATSNKVKGVTGKYFIPVGRQVSPTKLAQDAALARRLWEYSEQATVQYNAH